MSSQQPPHFTSATQSSSKPNLQTLVVWVLGLVAAALALSGAYFWGVSNASVTEVEILIPTPAPVVVQVVGEIHAPGVYELTADDRVLSAIEAAGGATEHADLESMNLAAIIKDGERVFVPPYPSVQSLSTTDQTTNPSPDESVGAAHEVNQAPIDTHAAGPINLNTATLDQLKTLPGIGDTRVNQIIAHRSTLGRFSTLEQLLEISGIGEKTLEAVRPLVEIR
ncbi:MAG: helix-hairpin-helix domain-containing protein [Chloroflexi bacterium]|nr:helix-hairpin-helix domain-containing protein [Chloroflexota bacterium]